MEEELAAGGLAYRDPWTPALSTAVASSRVEVVEVNPVRGAVAYLDPSRPVRLGADASCPLGFCSTTY